MTTSTASVNSSSSSFDALISANSSKQAAIADPQAAQDRFLKLLVAQLNNQDPMNPMDNAEMTTQMAQINTVSGIQQLNDTVKAMTQQFASLQVLQGVSTIGRDVLTEKNTLSINNGFAKGAFDIPTNADKVTVQILTPGGQVLDTINMGTRNAGRTHFEWDASDYQGTGNPIFKVTALRGGEPMVATSFAQDTIMSVSSNLSGGMDLQLRDGSTVTYSDIKAIL